MISGRGRGDRASLHVVLIRRHGCSCSPPPPFSFLRRLCHPHRRRLDVLRCGFVCVFSLSLSLAPAFSCLPPSSLERGGAGHRVEYFVAFFARGRGETFAFLQNSQFRQPDLAPRRCVFFGLHLSLLSTDRGGAIPPTPPFHVPGPSCKRRSRFLLAGHLRRGVFFVFGYFVAPPARVCRSLRC